MTAQMPGPDRCPTCSAAVKPGDPWCSLCYADLRPPPPPEPVTVVETAIPAGAPEIQSAGPDPLSAPLDALDVPTWPCTVCGAVNVMDDGVCLACGASFLSGLHAQDGPLLELPVVGDITRLGRGQRFVLAGAVVLAVLVLVLLVGLLFG